MGNVIQMQQECGSVSCDGKTRVQLPPVQWVLRMSGEQRGWHSGTVHFPDAQSDQNFGPMAELRWTNNMADYNEYAGKIESDSDFEDERYLCVDEMDRAKREYKTIESLLASRGVISADYDLPICRFRREDGRRCVYWLLEESGGVFAWAWPRGDYSDGADGSRSHRPPGGGCHCISCYSRYRGESAGEGYGFVYFVQHGERGAIKIGSAGNVGSRIAELQTGAPEKLRVLLTIRGGYVVEKMIQQHLGKHRTRGEWFNPAQEVLELINSLSGRSRW
jgi:hypothetical protein